MCFVSYAYAVLYEFTTEYVQTKVIPSFLVELEEDVGKLRRKLEAECPPVDFEKAQRLLEEGIVHILLLSYFISLFYFSNPRCCKY